MTMTKVLTTEQKAFEINLRTQLYGTLAEIGAGQEVARQFFQAGGAAGTIAKTMSAYDMQVSDAIYGKEKSGRYVCDSRVTKMMKQEYETLIERLMKVRPDDTQFFSYANTMAARSYKTQKDGHGWMGMQFMHEPGAQPSEIVIHIRMLDNSNPLQQQAVGRMGVNLIYACFYNLKDHGTFVESLMDNLGRERIEIDMIRVKGPGFEGKDPRLFNLELIKRNFTQSVIFDSNGDIVEPTDVLYKKHLLVLRGSFRPPTLVNLDMLSTGLTQFENDLPEEERDRILVLPEISVSKLIERGEVHNEDFLARVDILQALGQKVMISNKVGFYSLKKYLASMTSGQVNFVAGVYNIESIINDDRESLHPWGMMAGIGVIRGKRTQMYIYPGRDEETGNIINCTNAKIAQKHNDLVKYLLGRGYLKDIKHYNKDAFDIWSRVVLEMIQKGDKKWETMVPKLVADEVKKKKLFGYEN